MEINKALNEGPEHKSEKNYFWVLSFFILLTRLPYIFLGPGSADDAWDLPWALQEMVKTKHYVVSRAFGFPLYEILNLPLFLVGGVPLCNMGTVLAFIASLFFFQRILKQINCPYPKLLLFLYGFFPIFWKNSSVCLDYMWGLLFLMGAFYYVLGGRSILAALFLGMAVGCRATLVLLYLPMVILIGIKHWRKIILFTFISGLTSILFYIPVLIFYGGTIFTHPPGGFDFTFKTYIFMFSYRLIYSFGLPGFLAFLAGVLIYNRKLIFGIVSKIDVAMVLSILGILLPFVGGPHKAGYLITAFPFLFIWLARNTSLRFMVIFLVCALLPNMVNLDLRGGSTGRRKLGFASKPGLLYADYYQRQDYEGYRKVVDLSMPERSIILLARSRAFWLNNTRIIAVPDNEKPAYIPLGIPLFRHPEKTIYYYIYFPPYEILQKMIPDGFKVYYLENDTRPVLKFLKSPMPLEETGLRMIPNRELSIYGDIIN